MKNKHIILISMLSAGVLLAGIGTGIAVKEYTSLEYGGVRQIGEVKMQTKQTEYPIVVSKTTGTMDIYTDTHIDLKEDPTVPVGKIRLRCEYNENVIEPMVHQHEDGISFYYSWKDESDFEAFMDAKDQILTDIKDGRICEYRLETVEKLEVLVNPADIEKVCIM